MVYNLTCKTASGVKVRYKIAKGPIYNLIDDFAKGCIKEVREVHPRRKDLGDVVLDEDEHRCLGANIRAEDLKLLRIEAHSYKVVDSDYLKKHKPKSKRSIISGDDLAALLFTYNHKLATKIVKKK